VVVVQQVQAEQAERQATRPAATAESLVLPQEATHQQRSSVQVEAVAVSRLLAQAQMVWCT
jgi:hypothetical protein